MAVKDDIDKILAKLTSLNEDEAKVARLCYKESALTNADSDVKATRESALFGVASYDPDMLQNIPDTAHTGLNETITDDGVRADATIVPYLAFDHYIGRTSMNMNMLSKWTKDLTDTISNSLGEADGIAILDENEQIPLEHLPNEQATFYVKSVSDLITWAKNTAGNDYSVVSIKPGEYSINTSQFSSIDCNATKTKLVYGNGARIFITCSHVATVPLNSRTLINGYKETLSSSSPTLKYRQTIIKDLYLYFNFSPTTNFSSTTTIKLLNDIGCLEGCKIVLSFAINLSARFENLVYGIYDCAKITNCDILGVPLKNCDNINNCTIDWNLFQRYHYDELINLNAGNRIILQNCSNINNVQVSFELDELLPDSREIISDLGWCFFDSCLNASNVKVYGYSNLQVLKNSYRFSNVYIELKKTTNPIVYKPLNIIINCTNLINIKVTATIYFFRTYSDASSAAIFNSCNNISSSEVNITSSGINTGGSGTSYVVDGWNMCNAISLCNFSGTGSMFLPLGFRNCKSLSYCGGTKTNCFASKAGTVGTECADTAAGGYNWT